MIVKFSNTGVAFCIVLSFISMGCNQGHKNEKNNAIQEEKVELPIEAITVFGDTLRTPSILEGKSKENFEIARDAYVKFPDSTELLIWYGRRTAYLGHFKKAIEIYSEGIKKYPKDPRLFRHRGHRYISTRQYDKAISDLENAAVLAENMVDEIEPDGLPNIKNIPLGTLKGNIWYHLGLAYYLKGNYNKALKAFQQREVTNRYDDNLVSGGYWLFMILKRLGRDKEALEAISEIEHGLDIIENKSYYDMCLFYKGLLKEENIKINGDASSSDDVYYYALGNWHLYQEKDTIEAKEFYLELLKNGNPYSFAYLTAEADWKHFFD